MNINDDKPKEKCGVFGILNHKNAVPLTHIAALALQHRGEDSAGIVVPTKNGMVAIRDLGLVNSVFTPERLQEINDATSAIGHVRYSTSGDNVGRAAALQNVQPLHAKTSIGEIGIGHNGNLVGWKPLMQDLAANKGCIFTSTIDTEIFLHLIATSKQTTLVERLKESIDKVKGAYSLVLLTENCLIGVRDNHGFRPLVLGKVDGSYVLASETCALDVIDAEYIRDIRPGEIVVITKDGITSDELNGEKFCHHCSFEAVYFARPDSRINGTDYGEIRRRMGVQLAKEFPWEKYGVPDYVCGVPQSGLPAAKGFHEYSGIPLEDLLVKNGYIARTFIQPSQEIRGTHGQNEVECQMDI